MSQPTRGRLEDLWSTGPGTSPAGMPTGTQPLPAGEGPALPAGLSRPRVRALPRRFGPLPVELFLATLVSAGVAAGMSWQVVRDLGRVVPGTTPAPFGELWSLAWAGHVLRPGSGVPLSQIFGGNTFYPSDLGFASANQLLGYGPLTWFFSGGAGLATAFGILFVAAAALTSLGGYALARQLGAHPVAGVVAGLGSAYPPLRIGQVEHLHLLAAGPMLLALAMLARGHGFTMSGRKAPPRPVWALLGWLVAAWQLTVGVETGLALAYLLAVAAALVLLLGPVHLLLRRRRRARPSAVLDDEDLGDDAADTAELPFRPRRMLVLLVLDVAGIAAFAAAALLMVRPFRQMSSADPEALAAAHGSAQLLSSSPEPLGLVAPPLAEGTWSHLADTATLVAGTNEVRLLPGVVLLELALLGLLISSWRWWWRVLLTLVTAVLAVLSLGTGFPSGVIGSSTPFGLLADTVPGWEHVTAPGRLMVYATFALALLAAGGVSRLCGARRRGRPTFRRSLVVLALLCLPVLVTVEGWAPVPTSPVPPVPAALAAASPPVIVLPSASTTDGRAMFWSAQRDFVTIGNGQGAVTPSSLLRMREAMSRFPDRTSVAYLRQNGINSVVVLPEAQAATPPPAPGAAVDLATLGLTRQELGDSVLYTLASTP